MTAIGAPKRRPAGRRVLCSHCSRRTVFGKIGIFHKVLFLFCAACLEKDRPGCLAQMHSVASLSSPGGAR